MRIKLGKWGLTRAAATHFAWLAVFGATFAPTFFWLFDRWTLSVWQNGHGLLVPVVAVFIAWRILWRLGPVPGEPSRLGFLFLVPAVFLVVVDSPLKTGLLSALGLVISLPGLCLLLLGKRHTRALAFPLALLLFMLPIPTAAVEEVQIMLRAASAAGAEHLLRLLGFVVHRNHMTLFLPTGALLIANACSGFSTLYASVTLGLVLIFRQPEPRKRLVLVVAALACPVAFNILRCSALAIAVSYRGLDVLATPLHVGSGIASFCGVALVLLLLAGPARTMEDNR